MKKLLLLGLFAWPVVGLVGTAYGQSQYNGAYSTYVGNEQPWNHVAQQTDVGFEVEEPSSTLRITDSNSVEDLIDGLSDADLESLAEKVAEIQDEKKKKEEKEKGKFKAEYNKGFKISGKDKDDRPFSLRINGRLQFRYAGFAPDTEVFETNAGTIDVPSRNGFEIERGRLEFRGHLLTERLKYYLNLDADTDDEHLVIFHDYWFDYDLSDAWTVRVGKAKVAASYEWWESSTTTRFADRSLSTTFFRSDRSVGIWLLGEQNDFHYQFSITDGFDSTDLEPDQIDSNFAYTGLVYWDPWGDVGKGYSDLKHHIDPVVRLGSSASFINTDAFDDGSPTPEQSFAQISEGSSLTALNALQPGEQVNDFDLFFYSAFMTGKWRGFSFNSEFYARWLQNFETVSGNVPDVSDLFQHGWYLDTGYFLVPGKLEAIARVSQIDGFFGDSWEYAAGATLFFNESHKSKITFDATVLDGAPAGSSSPNFEVGQDGVLYRLQYQVAY